MKAIAKLVGMLIEAVITALEQTFILAAIFIIIVAAISYYLYKRK